MTEPQQSTVEGSIDGVAAESQQRRAGKPVEATVLSLWEQYSQTRSAAERNRLAVHYAGLVKSAAGRIAASLPPSVDVNDLIQYGMLGLLDAIEKFEPDRGFKFETYSSARIKGHIYDELRALDRVPRSVRTRIRSVERAQQELEARLNRTPTEQEIADELDIPVATVRDTFAEYALSHVSSLDDLLGGEEDNGGSLRDRIVDERVDAPGADLERRELNDIIREVISELPERDRVVVNLYYFEQLTLAEIGRVLNVTESRICQLHGRARLALERKLAAHGITGLS